MAVARRRRTQRTDDDQFVISLSNVLSRVLPPGQVQEGDTWFFHIEGEDDLIVTRSRATRENIPEEDPEP